MNRRRAHWISLIILLFFITIASTGFSQQQRYSELSLQECIDRVLKENLNFKSSSLGLRVDDLSIIQAESKFDPAFTIDMNRSESTTPTFFDYYKVNSIDSKSTEMNITVGQNLVTGGNWGVGLYNTLSESNIETEKNYRSNFGLQINQPLLKGFGKKISRSAIYLARLSKETTRYNIESNAAHLVYEVQNAYWNLVYAWETLKVRELSYNQADSLLVSNQKGLEVGVLTETDVLEAKSALLSRQQDVLNQKNLIRDAEDVLRRLLNLTSDADWRTRIIPSDVPSIPVIEIDVASAQETASHYRPELKIAQKNLEEQEMYVMLAKNDLHPRLDLSASYRLNGSGTTYGKDIQEMSDADAYGWSVGLLLSYPLRNRNAEAALEKRKVSLEREHLSHEDLKSFIFTEVRSSIRNIEAARERIDVARLSLEVNELKLRNEEERFRNQLSTSYYVLQFQNDLTNARNLYNKTLMDYIMAVADFRKAQGTLLRDLHITIIAE